MGSKRLLILLSLLACVSQISAKSDVLYVEPGALVHPSNTYALANLGVVKGYRSCGGPGNVTEWHYDTCQDKDPVCHVPADGVTRACQIEFIPSKNMEDVGLQFVAKGKNDKVGNALDMGQISTSGPLRKGIPYTVTVFGGVSEVLRGAEKVFQFIMYDLAEGRVEFCVEADLKFV